MQFNALLVLCNHKTAYEMDGLVNRMQALSSKKLAVIVVGRRREFTTHVDILMASASGKGRKLCGVAKEDKSEWPLEKKSSKKV